MEEYKYRIKRRSKIHYFIGLVARIRIYLKFAINRRIAVLRGAKIGDSSIIPFSLAIKANKNLVIGNDCILETSNLDLRSPIEIEDHCIINKDVQIIRLSHYIDDDALFQTKYYPDLIIHSYTWLATGCKILPNCCNIAKGSVVGAFSVLSQDTEECGVYIGFPAIKKRTHNTLFDKLVVCSLMGGGFKKIYKSTIWKIRSRHYFL